MLKKLFVLLFVASSHPLHASNEDQKHCSDLMAGIRDLAQANQWSGEEDKSLAVESTPLSRRILERTLFHSGRPKGFYSRMPHVDYVLANESTALWLDFFEQIAAMNFNDPSVKMIQANYFVCIEWIFGGWFTTRTTGKRARAAQHALSSDLIEGWRKLGMITPDGRFDFSVLPFEIRDAFSKATGWKTKAIHPVFWQSRATKESEREEILTTRRDALLEHTVILDDMIDYLFLLPMLMTPASRDIAVSFAGLSAFTFEGSNREPDSSLFLSFLLQDSFAPGAELYGPAPLVFDAPKTMSVEEMKAVTSQIIAMLEELENSPEPHTIHLVRRHRGRDAWLGLPFYRISTTWPVRNLTDHLIRALSSNLNRLFWYGPAERNPLTPSHLAHVQKALRLLVAAVTEKAKARPELIDRTQP